MESKWTARDLQKVLGYEKWESFLNVIRKARTACDNSEADTDNQFPETRKMVGIGSGGVREVEDYYLSRYACYLIAMNGDPQKMQIATAQSYFAIQTYRQEK